MISFGTLPLNKLAFRKPACSKLAFGKLAFGKLAFGKLAFGKLARLVVLVPIGTLLIGGCASTGERESHGVSATQFPDMVVPSGFKLRDNAHESSSRDEGGWRTGHFVYSGASDIDTALGYVRQNMPRHSWQIVKDEVVNDAAHVRFERGVYSADYTFTRRDGATHMVVVYETDYTRR